MEIETSLALFAEGMQAISEKERVPITEALQRVTACAVYAPMAVPNFPKAAMDGYAVRVKDTLGASQEKPVALKVLGKLYAGDAAEFAYKNNSCVRIMTGAAVPQGFDAVVKQEHTNYGEEECLIYRSVAAYENYCQVGEDIQNGQLLFPAGTRLEPLHIGLLASCGVEYVEVRRKLKVALLTTGSELTPLGKALQYGRIYNSIGYMLEAALKRQGIEVIACEQCVDDIALLQASLQRLSAQADFVITTGGISVGEKDLLPAVLASLQGELLFAKANIQPGTPTQGWLLNNTPILCLSGNPYAAYANFELYFWEAAAKLLGCAALKVEVSEAVLENNITKTIKHRRLLRAVYKNGYVQVPDNKHSASVISDLLTCNCFVEAQPGQALTAGQRVKIRLFK